MTSSPLRFRRALRAGCAALALLSAPAFAQKGPDFVDLGTHNAEIEAWRAEQQKELRRLGRATAEEFRKIDAEALNRARAAEAHRTRALEALSKKTGVPLNQGPGGTQPAQGRGSLGDIDTASLSGKDYHSTLEAAKKAGYTVKQQGDAFTIVELDTTVHRAPSEHSSPTGSSGRQAEIARGNNPETAMGLGRDDPAISVADNLKKAAHTVNEPPASISNSDLQKLGKMTGRNADAVTQVTGAPGDATTRAQADMLKQGYSPEAAGIVRDNATPQQRAQDIADFQNRAKQVSVEAARAADTHANQTMEKLAGDARHANEVLEAIKGTGDPVRTAKAQAQADAANKAVIDYHETRAAAQNAAVANDGDAAKIVNEARGVPNEGKSPSQIREAATLPDRKALTGAAAEPIKAPTLGPEPVKGPGAEPVKGVPGEAAPGGAPEGAGSKAIKGAGAALAGWAIYQGVKKGAEEAGKEAAEKGDGALTSTVKTIGYSAWHGVGIGPAIETGKRAGEESAKQWEKDVKDGKVDPNSKASQYWAQIRAVGWGISEFTGLQAIKDAVVEGGGYVKDRYGQYQAEKAEAKANAEKATGAKPPEKTAAGGEGKPGDKSADPKAGDKTGEAGKDKTADAKTGEAKTADGKTGDGKSDKAAAPDKDKTQAGDKTADKAAADKTAAEKAAAEKAAADKAAAEKAAADKLAADKLAAEKAAADKAARDRAKAQIGGAIAAAGQKAIKQTPPPVPVAAPPPPPPPQPPAPTTTEVEGGWLKDKNGTTKVVYINDAQGNRIGGYYVHFDANGREIGRESFKESAPEPQQPAPVLSGRYVGRISGQAGGSFEMTVSGASVSGRISGSYQGDGFTSSFSGAINGDGSFSAAARGVLQGNLGGKVSPYPFNGAVSGRVDGRSGAGSWSGKNQWGAASGSWSARK